MMNLPPLPKPWDLQHDDNGFPQVLFTAEQLRTYAEQYGRLCAEAEIEAAAKIAETLGVHQALNVSNGGPDWYKHSKEIAAAIRARSK